MHFLSIETSTRNCSLALAKDHKVIRFRNIPTEKALEDAIIPSIDQILLAAKVPFNTIDAFAVGLGPGSFTSLRVGLSTVKAFAMATGKPIVGICSLDVIAQGVKDVKCDEICVIVDARRNMVYSALYEVTKEGIKRKGDYALSDLASVLGRVHGRTLFVGDALGVYAKDIKKAYAQYVKDKSKTCKPVFAAKKLWLPQGKVLSALADQRLSAGQSDDPRTIIPMYLYAHDCQVSR